MSESLIEESRQSKIMQFHVPKLLSSRVEQAETIRRRPVPSVTDDEELQFVTRAIMWLLFLGVTPLILFVMVTYFRYPDLFLAPIALN